MTRIAHLSDLHIIEEDLEPRSFAERCRLSFLTFGRSAKPAHARQCLTSALAQAWDSGAEHLVITGDLTEDGMDSQFEALSLLLRGSRFRPSQITLLPGNHDAYVDTNAFARALKGGLRPFEDTSPMGGVVEVGDTWILPISVAKKQAVTRSAGFLDEATYLRTKDLVLMAKKEGKIALIAMHHPPYKHLFTPMQWIDGLDHHEAMMGLIEQHDHVYVLHGHSHLRRAKAIGEEEAPRIFSTEAVVDNRAPLNLYSAYGGRLIQEEPLAPSLIPSLALD